MLSLSLWTRLRSRYARESARRLCRRTLVVDGDRPFISFTFDDFARSSLLAGGAILQQFGIAGTYYGCMGLMGKESPTGRIFSPEDLHLLIDQGHELGCHTFGHCDAWQTSPNLFEESVIANQRSLTGVLPDVKFQTLSYPISVPRPRTKSRIAKYFACCRGGGQTFNHGRADLNYLAAYFLEKSRDHMNAVEAVITQNQQARGWLILATHDISESPSPFGCSPRFFERVVRTAIASGARCLPVIEALHELQPSETKSMPMSRTAE